MEPKISKIKSKEVLYLGTNHQCHRYRMQGDFTWPHETDLGHKTAHKRTISPQLNYRAALTEA